jgi:RimJ/RimL family protein N-acetyltransferase
MRPPLANNHGSLPTLGGSPVQLRQLRESDCDALLEIFGDPDVVRFMAVSQVRTDADTRALLWRIDEGCRSGTLFQWGIVGSGSASVVGTCTLGAISRENERAEIGFALARRYWGTGMMRAALAIVIDHAFDELGLHRIEADADPRNVRSVRLLGDLGFAREGYQRERYRIGGERQDSVLFGLLAYDWRGGPVLTR